jgi:hypothetical protein
MVVDWLSKVDKFLVISTNLSEKFHGKENLHYFFVHFVEAIKGDGYPLRHTFYLTDNLRKKIPLGNEDNYRELLNYYNLYKNNVKEIEVFDCVVDFVIGELIGDYYKIDSNVLEIEFNLYFHKDIKIEIKHFVAEKNISIFSHINKIFLKKTDMYIGGDNQNSLPLEYFERLIKHFPNSTEISHYRRQRIALLLREYYNITYNFEEKYHDYLSKKQNKLLIVKNKNYPDLQKRNYELINEIEFKKYQYLYNDFEILLSNDSVSELDWQKYIYKNNIFKFLFPKYVLIIREPRIKTIGNAPNKIPDFMCVDADGYVDIIELKNSSKDILRIREYRNNYVPTPELSSTIIQIEQYIFHLSNNLLENQRVLNDKYAKQLTTLGIKIKIVNPKGLLVIGRECKEDIRRNDFEIIKKHYKNIVDIITYDDLLRRLKTLGDSFISNN